MKEDEQFLDYPGYNGNVIFNRKFVYFGLSLLR